MLKQSLNQNWIFSYSTGNEFLDRKGATYKKTVDLPHDFMIGTERTADAGSQAAGGYFQGGIGTYEKQFLIPEEKAGRQFVLLFEGAYGNTEVWLNGNLVTLHHYGYTEFYVNISSFLKFGENNKLKVVVENNALPSSRWYTGAGLYRNVWLLEAGNISIEPWDLSVVTPSLDRVLVSVAITNTGEPAESPVEVSLWDRNGRQAAVMSRNIQLQNGKTETVFEFYSDCFHPWNLEDPYLYQAKVLVGDEERNVQFGVRTIQFSREGFFLNGTFTKLQGGCIHHDNGIAGACAFDVLEERKILKLKESGYNAVRTAHNPMSTTLLNACDKYGMLVLDECFDCWRTKKTAFDFHLYFEKYWKEELYSIIQRDRNHPSVIMYSIGNEIGERDGSSGGVALAAEMSSFVRNLDPTRAVTNGICAIFLDAGEFGGILANIFGSGEEIDFASLPAELQGFLSQSEDVKERWGEITAPFAAALDVVGYNYLDDRYEKDGILFPERIIVGTESYPGKMKQIWERTLAHPYVIGDFNWTAYDYMGESGIGHAFYDQKGGLFCEYPYHTGNCGDYDLNGNLRPQGQFRRLLWDRVKGPVITVLKPEHYGKKETVSTWGWPDTQESWTWPGFEGKPVRLDIFSKAQEVEILVNNRVLKRERVPDSWILQTDVIYEPGTLQVKEYNDGAEAGIAELATVGNVKQIHAFEEYSGAQQGEASGIQLFQIEAVDEAGNRVPWYHGRIQVSVEGGELIALGSADPVSTDNYTSGQCCLYEGRAMLIVRKTKETVKVNILNMEDF